MLTISPATHPPATGGGHADARTPPAAARQAVREGDPQDRTGPSDRPRVTPPMPYADWLRMLAGYQEQTIGRRTARPDAP